MSSYPFNNNALRFSRTELVHRTLAGVDTTTPMELHDWLKLEAGLRACAANIGADAVVVEYFGSGWFVTRGAFVVTLHGPGGVLDVVPTVADVLALADFAHLMAVRWP